ncbi:MAG: HAMP domain-containing histidine kinase [Deltaproteobacteria bacterium]|nr:HAMP domain-containing histidine kinase [Nannocystaceae bacterium]
MAPTLIELDLSVASSGLSAFVREDTAEILTCWETRTREALDVARSLDQAALLDELPILLRSVADLLDRPTGAREILLPEDVAERHARMRLQQGYDLGEVVYEFSILRECLVDRWQRSAGADAPARQGELRTLHRAIDQSISASVERYAAARGRTLTAMDKIATAAAMSRDLDDLLLRLLGVLQDSLPAVDTGAVWLLDSDALSLRAMVDGVPAQPRYELPIGEGFAGVVALTRAPLTIRDAAHDPRAVQDPTSDVGLDALFAVPLIDGDELIGVMQIGSFTASAFSLGDRQLFESSATRATSLIRQHMLGESARQATRLREQVLAIVSHDLRSPLAAMRLAATVLERTAVLSDPRSRKPLDAILRSTTRMERLINDLLDLGTLQRGGLSIEAQLLDISALLRESVGTHAPAAMQKGIVLQLGAVPESLQISGDVERLVQVLANLIGNATKFCKSGDAITVQGRRVEGGVEIEVRDTGPGIAAKDAQHIFAQYWSAARHARHGAGLGLYICKGIVEAHGGRIWLDSTPGEGSRFSFWLPLPAEA